MSRRLVRTAGKLPLEVILCVEARDPARAGVVGLPDKAPHCLADQQEDEGRIQSFDVVTALVLNYDGVGARAWS